MTSICVGCGLCCDGTMDKTVDVARATSAVARFLESFRRLHGPKAMGRLISMKVPEPLLAAFKSRCRVEGESR